MDARTDRELVLEVRPEAAVATRPCPGKYGRWYFKVTFGPAPGRPGDASDHWCPSEAMAWQWACARLGLRAGRP